LPHQNLPIENPPIQVGGVYGGNYHDAMIRLGLAIDGDLLRAEAFSRLEAAQDRREAGFSDWWKFAAQMLCDRPLLDFELIEVCLKSESRQAAELLRESDDSPAEAVPPSAGDDLNKPTKLMNAMTILVSNQLLAGRPMTEIAEKVGVSRQTLYSKTWKPFRDTIETMKNTLPRGSKDKDGNVEAEWSDV